MLQIKENKKLSLGNCLRVLLTVKGKINRPVSIFHTNQLEVRLITNLLKVRIKRNNSKMYLQRLQSPQMLRLVNLRRKSMSRTEYLFKSCLKSNWRLMQKLENWLLRKNQVLTTRMNMISYFLVMKALLAKLT